MAAAPVAGMRHTVEWLARLPGSEVPLPIPPLWLIFAYYGCLLLLLVPTKRPVPHPEADEVLIRVLAAGVNGPDVYQRLSLIHI